MPRTTVTLSEDGARLVQDALEAGPFTDAAEVVEAALRLLRPGAAIDDPELLNIEQDRLEALSAAPGLAREINSADLRALRQRALGTAGTAD